MARKTGPVKKMQTKPAQKRTPFRAPQKKNAREGKAGERSFAREIIERAREAQTGADQPTVKLQKAFAEAGL